MNEVRRPLAERESRQFFVLHDDGRVTEETGYECVDYADARWFPNMGQPGWGTTLWLGHSAFDTRTAAARAAIEAAEKELELAQDRLSRAQTELRNAL